MSWGVDIDVEHPDGYVSTFEVVDGHTYNLTRMWQASGAIPSESGSKWLDGQRCADLRARLLVAVIDTWTNPGKYEALNPENGWGDFEGFQEILTRFASMVHRHPTGVVRWNG